MKKFILLVLALSLFVYGCTTIQEPVLQDKAMDKEEDMTQSEKEMMEEKAAQEPVTKDEEEVPESNTQDWKYMSLKDIASQKEFKISDFKGKPVLLESFAVWCPTCTKQQRELKKLHEIVGDSVISISLDTDPNENEEKVSSHISRNGFDWYYAISPVEMTKKLIDEFGVGVVNAPQAPIILVCEDQSTKLLKNGFKDKEELQEEINRCKA